MNSNWSNLVARRSLLRELVVSELRAFSAGTALGWLWWLLDPLLLMLIYWMIFSVLLGRGGGYAPYPIFILCALIPWKHFASSVGRSTTVLRAKEPLIKSVPFPTMVLPLSIVLSGMVYFLFGFAVLLVAAAVWPSPRYSGNLATLAQAPLLMVMQVAVITGISLALSSLGVLVRDLGTFMTYVFRIGFYVSPGLYGVDVVREVLDTRFGAALGAAVFYLYMLNPFALLITGYRDCVFYGEVMTPTFWIILFVEAAAFLLAGHWIYQHYDRQVLKFL